MTAPGIVGIGLDLIENARVQESLDQFGDRFKRRVFLPGERVYCDAIALPHVHYAGRFAAKEAVSKAFGTGIGKQLGWLDIEIVRDDAGAPHCVLHGKGADLARARGVTSVLVSLTHTRDHSAAQAVLVGNLQSAT